MDKQEKFLELRIAGRSFDSIAKELDVSKPTLIKWSKFLHSELKNQKALEWEAFLDRMQLRREQRLIFLKNKSDRLAEEFEKRDLSEIPTLKLLDFILRIHGKLDELDDKVFLSNEDDYDLVGPKNWEA